MPNALSIVLASRASASPDVADARDIVGELTELLRQHHYAPVVRQVQTEPELNKYLAQHRCDIILVDHDHSDLPIRTVFKNTQPLHYHCLFLALFSSLDEQAVMDAVRIGVDGFLLRSNLAAIIPAINTHFGSEKKPIQKFLRNSEPVLRALLEGLTDSIWAKSRDGRYLLINPAGAKFLQRPMNDILGKTDEQFFPPETAAKIRTSDRQVIDSGETQTIEDLLTSTDGVNRTFQAVKGVFRDESGDVAGVIGIVRDVSARKQAEDALKLSEERFRSAFEDAAVGMAIVSAQGEYLRVNKSLTQILGYSQEEFRQHKIFDLVCPEDLAHDYELHQAFLFGQYQSCHYEKRYIHRQGHIVWAHVSVSSIRDDQGNLVHFVSQIQDISEQKKTEFALLKAKEEAEQTALRKSEFLATMSHEIRTPLNAVLGMANLLNETQLNSKQREFLDVLLSSGKSLLSIINDILDFSKIESGKIELKKETVDLQQLIRLAISVFHHAVHEKGLQIYFTISKKVPKTVVADSAWLRQILLNLISNAVKHTESGHIRIRVSLEKGSLLDHTGAMSLQFQVEDTGSGIPEDKQQSIFESFSQVSPGLSGVSGGTGLGLTICRKLVELMDGRIWVKSRLNQGSTFFFTIRTHAGELDPVLKRSQTPSTKLETTPVDKLGIIIPLRILVAEDNPTNRFVIKNQFESLGYHPVFAENGLEALDLLEQNTFDLVLMDVQMPKLNGIETAKRIRQHSNLPKDLRIVAMTAFASVEDEKKCTAAGMDDFLTKPAAKEDIQRLILKWFTQKANTLALAQPQSAPLKATPIKAPPINVQFETIDILDLNSLKGRIPFKPHILQEMLGLFRKDSLRLMQSLKEAYKQRDREGSKKAIHEMKGACMFMGAYRLKLIFVSLEQEAMQGNWQVLEQQLQPVETELALFESAFQHAVQLAEQDQALQAQASG